ncbi:hypothetical protein HY411_03180 [Candidatus Gottesmanbacteria bacterium]|nr:hypothetical protein [Candidatus Gottesmanbacteria bacterium]
MNSKWAHVTYTGNGTGNNALVLVPKQGADTKIAINDLIVSVDAATITRLFFVNDAGTRRRVLGLRFIANGNLFAHIPLAGSIISNVGERLEAEVEPEEAYDFTVVYETTN